MANSESQRNTPDLAVDRATQIRDYVEQLIALLGEHPECELKRDWPRNTPYHKAEMVKDIQATANSAITPGKEKYVVVGADQQTRTITGCNPVDYDDASIRQLLEQYLDPVPEFEVLSLKSSANVDFVVLRFPYQENRPIYARGKSAASETKFIWTSVRFGLNRVAPIRAVLGSGWSVLARNFWA